MNALARTDQVDVPAILAQGKTPSLPEWAKPLQSALAVNLQKTETSFADVMTLPPTMIPNEAQRVGLMEHQRSLNSSLAETPENGERWAIKTAEITSKLLLALGGQKNELAAEAKGEAYVASLEDVPWWAVQAAARSWYRGEARTEKGERYDFAWAPDPATLRRLAMAHVWKLRGEVLNVQHLLDAQPYVDCSEDLKKGRAAMAFVFKNMAEPEKLKGVSFDKAAESGRNLVQPETKNADIS